MCLISMRHLPGTASLLPADLLILLTTIDGLMRDFGQPTQKLIPNVEKIDDMIRVLASGTNSNTCAILIP